MRALEAIQQTFEVDPAAAPQSDTLDEAVIEPVCDSRVLKEIEDLNADFERRYKDKLLLQPSLSRMLVSFQANKGRAVYRWFKYKEAFSAGLLALSFR